MDMYGVNNVLEFVNRIENYFPLGEAVVQYRNTGSLVDFEIGLDKFINNKYVNKLKNIARNNSYIIRLQQANLMD